MVVNLEDKTKLCVWGVSLDIEAPNFESCKKCRETKEKETNRKIGATRDYAIKIECKTCLFPNADGSYTAGYEDLIKERQAQLTEAGV